MSDKASFEWEDLRKNTKAPPKGQSNTSRIVSGTHGDINPTNTYALRGLDIPHAQGPLRVQSLQ